MKTLRLLQKLSRVDLVDAVMAFAQAMAPARSFRAVTPDDEAPIAGGPARSLYVGGDGDVVVVNEAGEDVTFSEVRTGTILPVEVTHVKEATTAANIIAL